MLYIIIAILMFGILIALHEFGHFITAKLLGVRVNEFAIGMGPLLFSTQKGETQYSLRAIPMGGFCAMEGEDDASDDPRAFSNKPAWRKFIVLVAGSFMNFLTGFVLLALLLAQNTFFVVPVIDTLMEGFPYESAQGLLPGDRIVRVNGERIYTKSDLDLFFGRDEDGIMDLVIERDGVRLERPGFDLRPREYTYEGETVQMRGLICVREPFHVGNWLRQSWYNTIDMVRMVRLSLVDLFSGRAVRPPARVVFFSGGSRYPGHVRPDRHRNHDVGRGGPVSQYGGRTGEYPVVRGLHRHQPGGDEPAAHSSPGRRAHFLPGG